MSRKLTDGEAAAWIARMDTAARGLETLGRRWLQLESPRQTAARPMLREIVDQLERARTGTSGDTLPLRALRMDWAMRALESWRVGVSARDVESIARTGRCAEREEHVA